MAKHKRQPKPEAVQAAEELPHEQVDAFAHEPGAVEVAAPVAVQPEPQAVHLGVTAVRVTAHTHASRERGTDKHGEPRLFHKGRPVTFATGELSQAEIEYLKGDHCLTVEHI